MTLNTQFLTIISMTISGFYLGLAYDTYRQLIKRWQDRTFLIYILEMAFWISHTVGLFYILFQMNNGELRIYVFLASVLGFSLYQGLLAPLYRKALESTIAVMVRLFHGLWNVFRVIFLRPLELVFRFIFYCLRLLGQVLLLVIQGILMPFFVLGKFLKLIIPEKLKKCFDKDTRMYSIIKNTCHKILKMFPFRRG